MRQRLGVLAATATLAVAAACGGGNGDRTEAETAPTEDLGSDDPSQFDCENATGKEDWYAELCDVGAEEDVIVDNAMEWRIGEKRMIEYDSWEGDSKVQLEVELVGVSAKSEECAGPENPVSVLLDLRAENVGSEPTETIPQLSYHWLSEDNRRVDVGGCLGDEETLPALNPGQFGEGFERVQVPEEPGSLMVQTAYPFVDSRIELPSP